MTSLTAERKIWYRPHLYKANYVRFILIVIFRQYIILPEHLMLCAALNACVSIQCRFLHFMPFCIGINENSTENTESCRFWHIMPPTALNARIGIILLESMVNSQQDFPFNEHHRNSLTKN